MLKVVNIHNSATTEYKNLLHAMHTKPAFLHFPTNEKMSSYTLHHKIILSEIAEP